MEYRQCRILNTALLPRHYYTTRHIERRLRLRELTFITFATRNTLDEYVIQSYAYTNMAYATVIIS